MTTATVIPGVLGFLLSTTPVPSVTPTPVPPAMATAKAKTDRLWLKLPTSTSTSSPNVPEHWKEEAREYRKIRDWAEEWERNFRVAQDILREDADAYAWTAGQKNVEPEVAQTSQIIADSIRQKAKQLYELENLMRNVNVAATNGIQRRHLDPFKDEDSVKKAKKAWYGDHAVALLLAVMIAMLGVIALIRFASKGDKEAPQK